MSVGGIVILAIVAAVVIVLLVALVPRMRAAKEERRLQARRREVAGHHREEAEMREERARLAEREAERARAEAQVHEQEARLHDQGLADDQRDVGDARAGQRGRGGRAQLRVALDAPHVRGDLREHGRVIARAGADVEHALAAAQAEERDHVGDQRRLADRLPGADRQRAVLPRAVTQILGHEELARHARDRLDELLVQPSPAQRVEELVAVHAASGTPDSIASHGGRP